jgi:hypothetical protein
MISDIGEAALVLPLEPAFYWVSTNNGDDNQLFSEILQQCGGDFAVALAQAVSIAPGGASSLHKGDGGAHMMHQTEQADQVSNAVLGIFDGSNQVE